MSRKALDRQYIEQLHTIASSALVASEKGDWHNGPLSIEKRRALREQNAGARDAALALGRFVANGGTLPPMRAPREVEALNRAVMIVARCAQEVFDAPEEIAAQFPFHEEWDALSEALADWKAATNALLQSVQDDAKEATPNA